MKNRIHVKNNQLTDGTIKKRYRMYKSKKHWVYAAVLFVGLSGALVVGTSGVLADSFSQGVHPSSDGGAPMYNDSANAYAQPNVTFYGKQDVTDTLDESTPLTVPEKNETGVPVFKADDGVIDVTANQMFSGMMSGTNSTWLQSVFLNMQQEMGAYEFDVQEDTLYGIRDINTVIGNKVTTDDGKEVDLLSNKLSDVQWTTSDDSPVATVGLKFEEYAFGSTVTAMRPHQMIVTDEKPVISANDNVTISKSDSDASDVLGTVISAAKASATDAENGDLTLTLDDTQKNDLQTSKPGTYQVRLKATDEQGVSSYKNVSVTVAEPTEASTQTDAAVTFAVKYQGEDGVRLHAPTTVEATKEKAGVLQTFAVDGYTVKQEIINNVVEGTKGKSLVIDYSASTISMYDEKDGQGNVLMSKEVDIDDLNKAMANGDSVGIWNNTFGTLALTNSDSAEDIAEAYAVLTSYQGITFVYGKDSISIPVNYQTADGTSVHEPTTIEATKEKAGVLQTFAVDGYAVKQEIINNVVEGKRGKSLVIDYSASTISMYDEKDGQGNVLMSKEVDIDDLNKAMANGDSVGIWNNTFGTLALTNSDSAEDIAEAYAVLTSYQGITFVYGKDSISIPVNYQTIDGTSVHEPTTVEATKEKAGVLQTFAVDGYVVKQEIINNVVEGKKGKSLVIDYSASTISMYDEKDGQGNVLMSKEVDIDDLNKAMANGDSVGIWNNTFGTLALTNSDSAEDIAEAYAVLTSYQGITFVYEGDPNANVKPELQATNATIEEGNTDSIEALTKATAADKEDGDLTKAITVKDDGGFDANKAGTYQVVLAVADSAGKTAEKTVAITVTAKPVVNQKPVITAKDATIEVGGSETDVKTIVNAAATDKEDGDLTSNVKVKDDGGFDSNKAGTYDVVLTVKDSAGEKAKTTAKITVTAKPVDKISNAAEQKTVTRTIKYVYENGKKASTTIKQKIHFSRNVATNETTGEVTNGEWTTTNKNSAFKAVESPTIGGYTADKENVKKAKVTADSKNKVVTVTYAKVADASKPTTDTSTSTTGTTGSTTIIIGSGNTITNNPITNNDNDTVNNNTTNNDNDTTNNTTINNVTTIGTPTGDSTTDTTKTDTTKDSTTDTTKTDTTKDSTTDTTKTDTTKDSTTDTTKTDTTKDSTTDTTKTDTTKDSTTDTTKTDTTKDSTTDTTKTDTTKDSTTDTTKTDTTKDSTTDTTKTDTTKDSTTDTTKEDATKGDTITNNTTNNVNNGVINNNVTNNNGTSTGDTIKDDTTKNDTTTKGDTTNNVTTNNGGTTNNTTNNVTTNNGDTTNNTSATTTNDTTKGDTAKDDTTKDDSIKTANNKGTGSNTVGDTTNNNTAGTGGAAADNQNGAGTGVDGNGITSPTTSTIYTPASSSALRGVLPTTYTPAKSASGTTSGASTGSGYSATGSSITPSSYGVTSSRSSLPNTGEQHTTAASIIGVVIAGFAGLGLTIKKKFGKN